MTGALPPADRERLESLFERAAELPAAEHAAFIERECGSEGALGTELARLLAGLAGEDILGQIRPDAPSRAGTRIGPYRLIERIGQGGMGEVYAAEQLEPVVRRVALKVIKAGMDSAQVVARFEAERQALARMTHPNIAQVYDGGATSDGRPYFVMELVEGEPVTEYCDRNMLSTRERIELFGGICDGVRHAHQKGIIHRDLKPSNLLVMQQDGRAVPKVIDFGVARATTGRLAEGALHTLVGQIVGTLDYMSPEQADPSGADVDTRSDVYSLGVVLYQLASGLLPFEHHSSADMRLSEIQRAIRETDPPTPSTRLRRQRATATALAPLHGTDERSLIRQLSGDLDWICMKALEKDPARRYQSVNELADDLRRHLAHEPVLAGRPGALYRARKFARRHRLAVTAGALVAASAVVGLAGIVSGRLEAEAQALVARAQRDRAEESERLARAETAKVLRLSDIQVLRGLEAEASGLWPPHPERIPELAAWMERAVDLAANREIHSATLAEMRERALPRTAEEDRRDREAHEATLAKLRAELKRLSERSEVELPDPVLEAIRERIEELEEEIGHVEELGQPRRTWRFELPEDQWWHDTLAELLAKLESIEATLLAEDGTTPEHGWSAPRRLALARELERSFAERGPHREAWARALAEIGIAYPGLDLRPQMGLVPLGPDPDSGLWEFAHLLSGVPAERGADGELVMSEETGLVLVLLPGGTFWMGAQSTDPEGRNYDPQASDWKEGPVHEVTLEPFFLSKFEMTRGQWWRSTGGNPGSPAQRNVRPATTLPVRMVKWTECDDVARHLGLTLPSEEQWEYAARAGTTTVWPTGDDEASLEGYANLYDQTGLERFPDWTKEETPSTIRDGFPGLAPAGSLLPNPFGLHDILGNAYEWCANPPYVYGRPPADPAGIEARSARSGSSRYPALWARSSARRDGSKSFADPTLGLRPARVLDL